MSVRNELRYSTRLAAIQPHRHLKRLRSVLIAVALMATQFGALVVLGDEQADDTLTEQHSADEFDFSEFRHMPSSHFRTTDPSELFDPGQRSIRSASHQAHVADELPVNEDQNAAAGDAWVEPQQDLRVPLESAPPTDEAIVIPDGSASGSMYDPNNVESLKDLNKGRDRLNLERLAEAPYQNYRSDESMWSWIPGTGDDFGWFSLQSTTYQARGQKTGFGGMINIHWLGGPTTAPLNPRLYDFGLGFQARDSLSPRFSYDLSGSIGAYSDFEGSAREGVRFPAHAVGMIHVDQGMDVVFGVDYLDRDDYNMLPVFGLSFHNLDLPGLRLDLIFPRPRIEYALSPDSRAYLSGSLGGGMWEVEFPDQREHVMTYGDYRLMLGFESVTNDDALGALEFGYIFHRRLEFRDLPQQSFDDAFLLQWVMRR